MLPSVIDTTVHKRDESSQAKRKSNTYGERCMQSVMMMSFICSCINKRYCRWQNMTVNTNMAARLAHRTRELSRSNVVCSDETLKKQKKKYQLQNCRQKQALAGEGIFVAMPLISHR